VIGGGPAGLRAAEIASAAGAQVILCDQKRSVGRKFLVAGKGGLNLTHAQEREEFSKQYRGTEQPVDFWGKALERFDNRATRKWAAELGVGTFQASSGRIYPKSLKGAPLLRQWIGRLREQKVEFRMNHQLSELGRGFAKFTNGEEIHADAIILALGGGSWPQTGSDGRWVEALRQKGVSISPLSSANCGWEVAWPEELISQIEGQPIKNVMVCAGGEESAATAGELMLTQYGLEGGPMYKLGPALRVMDSPMIQIDLKPSFTVEKLVAKMESAKKNFLKESQYRWKLNEVSRVLLDHYHGPFDSAEALAQAAKKFTLPLTEARPIAEAISSVGGVKWSALNERLMLKQLPGTFVAGEMIDWEAPTGGYLLQGCLSSGTLAAEAALDFIKI